MAITPGKLFHFLLNRILIPSFYSRLSLRLMQIIHHLWIFISQSSILYCAILFLPISVCQFQVFKSFASFFYFYFVFSDWITIQYLFETCFVLYLVSFLCYHSIDRQTIFTISYNFATYIKYQVQLFFLCSPLNIIQSSVY